MSHRSTLALNAAELDRQRQALIERHRQIAFAAQTDPKAQKEADEALVALEAVERKLRTAAAAQDEAVRLDRTSHIDAERQAFADSVQPARDAVRAAVEAGRRERAALEELFGAHIAVEESQQSLQRAIASVIRSAGYTGNDRQALYQQLGNHRITQTPYAAETLARDGWVHDQLQWYDGLDRRAELATSFIDSLSFQEPAR